MSTGSIVTITLSLVAALACSWYLLSPVFASKEDVPKGEEWELRRKELEDRREQYYKALEELEQELLSAKIPEEYYQASRAELMAEVAQVLAQLEEAPRTDAAPQSA